MVIGRGEPEQLQIEIRGQALEQVKQFKYLGSLLTEDGKSEKEVKNKNRYGKRRNQPTS